MIFSFQQMLQEEAEEIANEWKYSGIYSFYDITTDEKDYAELVNQTKRSNNYFSCYVDNELVAYYSVDIVDENKAEIGLGLRPEFTGRGYGLNFVNEVMIHITSWSGVTNFMLSVALFNQRAIKVYKKAGFSEVEVYMQNTNGNTYEFIRMIKN